MADKRLVLLYHFFAPDDVVSSVQFSQLGQALQQRGWEVEAWPCNRVHSGGRLSLALAEDVNGVKVRRVWRPAWRQSSGLGRMMNAVWMVGRWGLRAALARRRPREVMIVGTDPVMGVVAAVPWKFFRRGSKVAHWCFDLYPEAAVADEKLSAGGFAERLFSWLSRLGYHRCDYIADLGPCMRKALEPNTSGSRVSTITPWALVESEAPPEPNAAVRASLFGDARLALLYSGSFGRAHSYTEFLRLARELRDDGVGFCFAGRGHRADELKAAVGPEDKNVRFAGFAAESELESRLTSCDLHLVSLNPEWTGTVVPSKFFGALAAGRGVLFAGSEHSAIAYWIREHRVGWVLTPDNVAAVAAELRDLRSSPDRLRGLRDHCHAVYQLHFSRENMIDKWDEDLTSLLN